MRTKEDIVAEISNSVSYLHAGTGNTQKEWHRIYDSAMDEYAKEVAIDYLGWVENNGLEVRAFKEIHKHIEDIKSALYNYWVQAIVNNQ